MQKVKQMTSEWSDIIGIYFVAHETGIMILTVIS